MQIRRKRAAHYGKTRQQHQDVGYLDGKEGRRRDVPHPDTWRAQATNGWITTQKLQGDRNAYERGYELGQRDRKRSTYGCFIGSTLIVTASGLRRIDSLRRGDYVLSWNAAARTRRPCRVLHVRYFTAHHVTRLTFADGDGLDVTPLHSVCTPQGWRRVSQLRVGDQVVRHTQRLATVAAIANVAIDGLVYNLVTEHEHTYIAGGVVVHNFTYLRRTRMAYYRTLALLNRCARALRHRPPMKA